MYKICIKGVYLYNKTNKQFYENKLRKNDKLGN